MSAAAPAPSATTRDAFYGGRLVLTQPAKGHRSGSDAVLLAAAAPPGAALCYDMGSGVGAVGLGVALLRDLPEVVLVERDAATAALARTNAAAAAAIVTVACCDILDRAALRCALPRRAGLVLTNPPFHDPRRSRASPDAGRRGAHHLGDGATIGDWLAACLDRLAPKGTMVSILAAAALPDALRALEGRTGGVTAKPILPRIGAPAHRVLVRAVEGSRAPFTLAAPLVLHGSDGRFTADAEALHRGDRALDW